MLTQHLHSFKCRANSHDLCKLSSWDVLALALALWLQIWPKHFGVAVRLPIRQRREMGELVPRWDEGAGAPSHYNYHYLGFDFCSLIYILSSRVRTGWGGKNLGFSQLLTTWVTMGNTLLSLRLLTALKSLKALIFQNPHSTSFC